MSLQDGKPVSKPSLRAKILAEYATLFRTHNLQGPILEIAAGKKRESVVSAAPFLRGFERHVVLDADDGEVNDTQFHQGSPHDLTSLFDENCFSTVIWDRAIEGDAKFWLTAAEIGRVLMPGGMLVLCTRGYSKSSKFGIKVVGAGGNPIPFLTATAAMSTTGTDHVRFSPQGLRQVVLGDYEVKEMRSAFMVPHLFAVAAKPA